jgi:2-polyprenyl-6-methoxyphenol hydroxylase-like FAD-dependent oxidoreductase
MPPRRIDSLPDTAQTTGSAAPTVSDVTVIGGGLAGKAASLQLARAGLNVTCIEPEKEVQQRVGESLDWSAPDLLAALGQPMEDLIQARIATWKKHVTLKLRDGRSEQYVPTPWLAGAPFHIELRTMHVDRLRLDQELQKMVLESGVTLVCDKVVRVETSGKEVSAILTSSGRRFSSPWFIDASGFGACLLAREFKLPAIQFGPAKVAFWTYFPTTDPVDGTTLYMESAPNGYLDWVWEIPISADLVSVGYVTTGEATKGKRERGFTVEDIFRQQLMKFPRFESLPKTELPSPINATSYRSRVHAGVAGPNWLIAGEAASMMDPITANGVTAALRHAREASALILKYRKRGRLPLAARIAYATRILDMAKFFNGGIEKIVYEPPVRNRVGLGRSGTIYTSPAWSINALYARLKPAGIVSTFALSWLLRFFRACAWVFYQECKRRVPAAEIPG